MADPLNKTQRSYCMSRIRSKNTSIEVILFKAVKRVCPGFRRHVAALPGRPDIVFKLERLAVFIDGDFWHGWQFSRWAARLQERWRQKIQGNRARDRSNFSKLRRRGWRVVRIWEHQILNDVDAVVTKIKTEVINRRGK